MEGAIGAKYFELPCVVRNMTDDEAIIAMLESNMQQRQELKPSEKAFVYKMQLEAIRRQAGRPQKNSVQVGLNLSNKQSRDIIAEQAKDSSTQIQRYIRLTELIKPILDMMDETGKPGLVPAVNISYLSKPEQEYLFNKMEMDLCYPSMYQSKQLKDYSTSGKLSTEGKVNQAAIDLIMQEEPKNEKHIKIQTSKIKSYFKEGTSIKDMEKHIIELLSRENKRQKDKKFEHNI